MRRPAADPRPIREPVACPDCGLAQRVAAGSDALCRRCGRVLERASGRNGDAALACLTGALLLWIPGVFAPALESRLLDRAIDGRMVDGAIAFWRDGFPAAATLIAFFAMGLPFLRTALLVAVLGSLRPGHPGSGGRGGWRGRAFRTAEALRVWSTPLVYLLAGGVVYGRVSAQLEIEVLAGGWCFIGATALLLIGEASLDRRRVWRAILPPPPPPAPEASLGCRGCGMVLPLSARGGRCPRCAARLRPRKPAPLRRAGAMLLAALALYPVAILLPMTRTTQPTGNVDRNILDGVVELFSRGFWYLGVIVLAASVLIPLGKIVGLGWFIWRARRPRARGLVLRTKAHRAIDGINRFSFVDPYIVALTAPIMAYPGIAEVRAGPGALPFAMVIVLTMLASRFFDTRLMWDRVER